MKAGAYYGTDLAVIHHAGFGDLAEAAAPELVRLLRRSGIRDGLVLDLGSGSGILARELTSCGYDVLGMDTAAAMIRLARSVAPRARFLRGSLHTAPLPPCRAIVAIGESIAYLPSSARRPASLRPLFARAARALRPQGLFVFDLIVTAAGPPMAYQTWRTGDDWDVVADTTEDRSKGLVRRRIVTFSAIGTALYRRGEEHHLAGVYDEKAVRQWLESEGFSVAVRRTYGRFALPPRRLAFVARLRRNRRVMSPARKA